MSPIPASAPAEIQELKPDYTTAGLDDADIALRNIPGGDHNE